MRFYYGSSLVYVRFHRGPGERIHHVAGVQSGPKIHWITYMLCKQHFDHVCAFPKICGSFQVPIIRTLALGDSLFREIPYTPIHSAHPWKHQ